MNWKKYRFVILFLILTLLCMAFIFGHSLMPAKKSNAESDRVIAAVKPVIDPHGRIPERELNFLVRKGAHITEFAVLALCFGGFLISLSHITRRKYPFAGVFLTLATAVTDEYIQSFLDRTSQVRDVLIDFSGSLIGFLIVTAAVLCWKQLAKKKNTLLKPDGRSDLLE